MIKYEYRSCLLSKSIIIGNQVIQRRRLMSNWLELIHYQHFDYLQIQKIEQKLQYVSKHIYYHKHNQVDM